MSKTVSILKKTIPFLITLVLWRLSVSFWNPAGILSLIPIFYYTFVRPINWFVLFGLLFCFLIDYRCNLPLFWTSMLCLFYAINGFQTYTDITHMDNNGLYAFLSFIGFGFIILSFNNLTLSNFINNLWLFGWMSVLYIPITETDKWVKK